MPRPSISLHIGDLKSVAKGIGTHPSVSGLERRLDSIHCLLLAFLREPHAFLEAYRESVGNRTILCERRRLPSVPKTDRLAAPYSRPKQPDCQDGRPGSSQRVDSKQMQFAMCKPRSLAIRAQSHCNAITWVPPHRDPQLKYERTAIGKEINSPVWHHVRLLDSWDGMVQHRNLNATETNVFGA